MIILCCPNDLCNKLSVVILKLNQFYSVYAWVSVKIVENQFFCRTVSE